MANILEESLEEATLVLVVVVYFPVLRVVLVRMLLVVVSSLVLLVALVRMLLVVVSLAELLVAQVHLLFVGVRLAVILIQVGLPLQQHMVSLKPHRYQVLC